MHDHLSIGLADKFHTLCFKLIFKLFIVFDDAIVYDDEIIQSVFSEGECDALIQVQFKEAMNALQDMSEEQRMSFILRHYYGYSIEEISNLFGVATGTTKSRIFNAIQKIRKKLGG